MNGLKIQKLTENGTNFQIMKHNMQKKLLRN